jgi:hypothetical protein
MIELFGRARWDQAYDFLHSGDPPMIYRLLAINTVFLTFYVIRRTRTQHKMKDQTVLQVQALLLLANFLILFQRDIQRFLDQFI